MPIIHEPHVCDKPATYRDPASYDPSPAYVHGTIWQCGECGRYWWFERFSGLGFWNRVRFWNLISKHRIRKGHAMTLRKIAGALIICAIFAALAVGYSIESGHWWFGPLVLLAGFALFALISFAAWLTMGDD